MEWQTLRFDRKLGVAGVFPYETVVAKQVGRWFEWPMLLLAFLIPIHWYFEYKEGVAPDLIPLLNWGIWGLFMLETLAVTLLCSGQIQISAKQLVEPSHYRDGFSAPLAVRAFACVPAIDSFARLDGRLHSDDQGHIRNSPSQQSRNDLIGLHYHYHDFRSHNFYYGSGIFIPI
ncbi:MAG: hypothetical protein Kow0060_10450 [Methylohalobius crimeensis]